jgi:hypothetical protein
MKTKKRFDVLSPDGFSIDRVDTYSSRKKAIAAFEVWKKRYEAQGYYSSNRGRIALEDLADCCSLIEI